MLRRYSARTVSYGFTLCERVRERLAPSFSRRVEGEKTRKITRKIARTLEWNGIAIKYSEKPLAPREEETNWRKIRRGRYITITFVVLSFPCAVNIYASPPPPPVSGFAPRDAFKSASKSNYFALTGKYPLKLDVQETRRPIVVYDAQKSEVLTSTTTASC